jgi:hypothetical protein
VRRLFASRSWRKNPPETDEEVLQRRETQLFVHAIPVEPLVSHVHTPKFRFSAMIGEGIPEVQVALT